MKDKINQIQISSQKLLNNFDYFQGLIQYVFPVVKSNAYGHGIAEVSQILMVRSFPYLVFDKYYEYENNKMVIAQNVLIMGSLDGEDLDCINFEKVAIVVQSKELILELSKIKQNIKIHLEINTGMNRWGIEPFELLEFLNLIRSCDNLELEGIMSHLADADGLDMTYTESQTSIFDQCVTSVFDFGLQPKYIHLEQTAGSVKYKSKFCNSIRPGIGIFGINNFGKHDYSYTKLNKIQPVLNLCTQITKIIQLKKNDKVGYNCTFVAMTDCNIAIIPIGYFEGLNRGLSNIGFVKIKGKYYQFAGKICMNIAMIDLRKDIYDTGTKVEIISNNQNNLNSIDNIARITHTLNYNLLTNLNCNLIRKII